MDESDKHRNGEIITHNGLPILDKQIANNIYTWLETVTDIDLSYRSLQTLSESVKLPVNLQHLNLSHNKFTEVPAIVLNLKKLSVLDLSYNAIEYFDDYPEFYNSIELLDLSHNNLLGPPYWVWTCAPGKLTKLKISHNPDITRSFIDGYFEELLKYSTLVTDLDIENCRLGKFTNLLITFPKVTTLCLGSRDYQTSANALIEIPSKDWKNCLDLQSLNACNTNIYTINPSIEKYQRLIEIDLADNNLNGLPNEFCNLEKLEICVLSSNKLLYLPDGFCKLEKLQVLHLDNNELCMLPEMFYKLENLNSLDLYNNHLNEVPCYDNLAEFDFAQNYGDEPENAMYLEKREQLRSCHQNRMNGRKEVITHSEYDDHYSEDEDDNEVDMINSDKSDTHHGERAPSSPEDWDSDEYWEPCHVNMPSVPSPWLNFVKKKMKEGNFCPMDAHVVSIAEKIKYERKLIPVVFYESDGQYDDFSSDES